MTRRSTRIKGALQVGLWGLLATMSGCKAEEPAPMPARLSGEAPAAAPGAASRRTESPLRHEDGLVWVRTQSADPRRLLWEVSEEAGFLLDVTDLDESPLSIDLEAAPLQELVAAIAREYPFVLDYERDAASGRHVVVSVRIGRAPEVARAAPRPARPAPAREEPRRERLSPDFERLIRAFDIANVDARRELIDDLDASGVELDVLSHLMENDPDPELRAMAADTLATSGSYGAVRNLIGALDSDDPGVLLVAIEALEFAGDESVVPELARLFDHSDPAVREASREAAEFLR